MASNSNQGLHFALIVLFALFVVLSVTTFIFFKNSEEAEAQAKKDSEALKAKTTEWSMAVQEAEKLKMLIGLKGDSKMEDVDKTFEADKKRFAAAVPPEKLFYRDAVEAILVSLDKAKAETKAASDQIAQLQTVNAAYAKSVDEKVKVAEEAKTKAIEELNGERMKFMEAQMKAEAEKKELADRIAKIQQDGATAVEKVKKDTEAVEKKLGTEMERGKQLVTEVDRLTGKTYAVDDGTIRAIDQRTRTVFIDVGRLDGLRPMITFTIHPAGLKPTDDHATKAKIEVSRILGDHLAEARILDDSMKDPIVPGDKLFTPLWDPGRPEHFAIAGKIDLDGDDSDDRDRLKTIIELNGGVLDAELEADGNVKGRMGVDTRYLVLGPMSGEKTREGYNTMVQTAKQYGTDTLSVDKFLDHIGWHDTTKLVRFGAHGNIDKVAPRDTPDGGIPVSQGAVSEVFKRRRPVTD
jgi:hypothetical protein